MWWRDLLFIHYPFAPEVVQALLPDDLTIDTWPDADGIQRAWVALVPFEMVVGTPGGLRLPFVGTFPETNVRTYVRGPDGTPGVWFCSLEAGGLLASLTARAAYGLPYFWADMSIDPGAGRPTACGVTTPPAGGPAAARPTGHCRPITVSSVSGHASPTATSRTSNASSRHAGGSIPAFRAWTRRERSPSMPPSITDAGPSLRRTPRTRRRTPRRCRASRADR